VKRPTILLSASIFSLMLLPLHAHACGCGPLSLEYMTGKKVTAKRLVRDELKRSKAVFSGEVLTIGVARNAYWVVTFKVERTWKYVEADEVTILTPATDWTCGYNFEVGQRYLVYASLLEAELWTNHCTRTGRIAGGVPNDLRFLGKGRAPRRSTKSTKTR
jgi:hypothetical protein